MGNQPTVPMTEDDSRNISFNKSFECLGDPRSPTNDIVRTPIHPIDTSKVQNITKNIDLTKECFDKYEKVLADPSIKNILNQWDPRSPTLDFQRTPLGFVLKNAGVNRAHGMNISGCSHQDVAGHNISNSEIIASNVVPKNLYSELNSLAIDCTDEEIEKATDEPNDSIVSHASTKLEIQNTKQIEDKMLTSSLENPIIGLLETNLDYVETDLDTVRRRPQYNKPAVKGDSDSFISINNSPDSNIVMKKDLSKEDPRSPSIGIDRTPIVIESKKDDLLEKKSNNEYVELNLHLQEMFKNNLKMQQRKERGRNNGSEKITESLLIYEDDFNKENTPIAKIFSNNQVNEGCRTPLSCMTNVENGQSKPSTPLTGKNVDLTGIKKNISKLGNSKSKIPIKISKISSIELPNAGENNNRRTIVTQKEFFNHSAFKNCKTMEIASETTPPNPRKACWDHDNSVIL